MDTFTILSIALGAVASFLLYKLLGPGKGGNYPPGPSPWLRLPIFGHLLLLDRSKIITEVLAKMVGEYGPIFGLWMGNNYAIILSDPKLIRDTLNDTNLNGRPDNVVFKAVAGGNHGLLFADGPTWVEQRRFTLRHLREFGFGKKSMEALILEEAKDLVDGFKLDVGKSVTGLGRRFSLAVLSSLWFIVSGERLHHDNTEMKAILEGVFRQMDAAFVQGSLSTMPWMAKVIPEWSGYNNLLRAIGRANEYLKPYIERHEETLVEGQPRDYIDSYLEEMRKQEGRPGSSFDKENGHKNLLAVITDLFGAGAETTSTTLDWAVLYLATNPHVQEELHAEIDAIVGRGRLPSLADRPRMPFTEATMQEVLRLSSIAGLGLFHTTLSDMKIGGYDIPKGTWVVPNLHYVHHDPKTWPAPNEFNPARFLSEDGKSCVRSDALMPFVVGKRVCIGETLARDEFFLFLTCLFQRYSIEMDPEGPPADPAPRHTFILKPQPYHVIMRERGA